MVFEQARRIADEIRQFFRTAEEKAVTIVGLALLDELTRATPVDTGLARSNWIPTFNNNGPGKQIGTINTVPLNFSLQANRVTQLKNYKTSMGQVAIENRAKHLVELNQGKSSQAPAGFIEAALRRARRKADAELARLRNSAGSGLSI